MKRTLLFCTILLSTNLHAFSCFGTKDKVANPTPHALLDTSSTSEAAESAFTLVQTFPGGINPNYVAYSHNGKFAAIGNRGGESVSVYEVDCKNGTFSEIEGSPFPAGGRVTWVAYSPCDTQLAISFGTTTSPTTGVTIYNANCETGALQELQTLTNTDHANIRFAHSVAYSPDGRFLAVTNGLFSAEDNISVYRVLRGSGKLLLEPVQVLSTPFAAPGNVAYSPNGKVAAVPFQSISKVANYQVDPVTGKFLNVTTFDTDDNPVEVTYSHNGRFAAVVTTATPLIDIFTVDGATGTFNPSYDWIATGNGAQHIAFSTDDTMAATADAAAATATVFCVDPSTGFFTFNSTVPAGQGAVGIDFAPCSNFAAVGNGNESTVMVFQTNPEVCQ